MHGYDRTLDLRNFLKAVLKLSHICLGLTAGFTYYVVHSPIYSISQIVLQRSYVGKQKELSENY